VQAVRRARASATPEQQAPCIPMAAGVLHPCASRRHYHNPDLETCKRCVAAAGARHPCGSRRPVALRERAPHTPAPAGALHPWHSRRYAPAAPGACPCLAAARRTPFGARGGGGAPADAPEPAAAADWVRRLPRGQVRPGPAAQQPLMGGSNLFTPVGAAWRPSFISICMVLHALCFKGSRADT